MRSWVFRNRARLEELLGRRTGVRAGSPRAAPIEWRPAAEAEPELVLVPVRRRGADSR
jgi:hypothetical protein